jgi:hypothetical protein
MHIKIAVMGGTRNVRFRDPQLGPHAMTCWITHPSARTAAVATPNATTPIGSTMKRVSTACQPLGIFWGQIFLANLYYLLSHPAWPASTPSPGGQG